jgi:beta-barrel assembly-enhancing protease
MADTFCKGEQRGSARVRVAAWRRVCGAAIVSIVLVALSFPIPVHAQLFGISEQQEINIGHEVERQLARNPGFVDDQEQLQHVKDIGLKLAHVSERPHLPWTYHILNDKSVNALAAPGGFVFVTRGLLGFVKSADELGFVLGHETTHIAHRHAVDLAEKNMQLQLITQILFGGNLTAYQLSQVGAAFIGAQYSRDKEFEADHFGVIFAKKAGFDPTASLAFFERLARTETTPSGIGAAFANHPPTPDRIAAIRAELREMGYQVPGPATPPPPPPPPAKQTTTQPAPPPPLWTSHNK